ncbi:MAG: glycosyltransferase family 1 protein [Gaiellales bacterium]|nr:MAG: glycosyltransferase family 1 protein [Gaiellales bacterium]
MIEGRDIICISPGYWDSPWITHQQFMRVLARKNRVLYVEPPMSYLPFRYPERWSKLTAFRHGVRREGDNLWITTCPPAPPLKRSVDLINRASQRLVLSWTRRAAVKAGFTDPLLWIYLPTAVELVGKLDESFVLYHCIDEFEAVPWGRNQVIASQEQRMLGSADLTVTCSKQVFENKRGAASEIMNVPNGVDFEHYFRVQQKHTPVAPELGIHDGNQVIGFSGVLDDRLDTELLLRAADRYPRARFVLVGPARKAFPELERKENIYLLGNRPVEKLPTYVKGFDVCLIPYVLNDFVRNISPTKLFEYLASGKPVVAPAIRALDGLRDLVYVGANMDEMLELIGDALAEDSPEATERRTELARMNTWEQRVDVISEKIMELERSSNR